MRHPRLITGPPLIAVAHGSRDRRAAAAIGGLLALVRARADTRGLAGLDVRAAFLDHCAPTLPQVLGSVTGAAGCVVVPLLLTAAYHSKTDIPAQIASAHPIPDVRRADTLGPHPLLLAALERRMLEAGVADAGRSSTSVVLAAAGSSDPAANATIAALAARWQRDGGWRAVVPAYACAASPSPAEAVRALLAPGGTTPPVPLPHGGLLAPQPPSRVVVATYLLAPGYFADKIRREALDAGAGAVCDALGAAPEVADVILERYAAAAGPAAGPAAAGIVARAQLS